MKQYLKRITAVVLASLLSASVTMAQQVVPPATPGVLKVGFIPAEDARAMVRQSQAIMDKLAAALDMKVEAFVGSDYNATIEALRANHIDVALLGPFSYVLATTQAPVEAFAITVTAKTMQPGYHSIIITQKDSTINSLNDIKGHTYAFVDPGSTSGFMVPSTAFIQAGIVPEKDFKEVMYSGGHDASIVAVAEGKVEAASVADRILERAFAKGLAERDKIKVIWESPMIPNNPMLYRKNLPEDLKKKIREAFYSFKNMPFGEMGTVARFQPASDKDYDPVRDIAKALKLDLTKKK
ncbi:MAG: phosphonate ABC transporter substrate-binding protein [Acidiferrobacterales bacterium]